MNARSPDAPTFFVDRSLGSKLVPEALKASSLRVERLDDHFAPNCPDVEWLPEVARRGWIVLTRDQNLRWRPLERHIVVEAGLRVFVVRAKDLSGPQIVEILLTRMPAMLSLVASRAAPYVVHVRRDGLKVMAL